MEKVIIIGAGPCGLAAGLELKERGVDPLLIEKGPLVNSIFHYPTFLTFHSTAEKLEIGGVPFVTPNDKPTRLEGLTYYRTVAQRKGLRVHLYETVESITPVRGGFAVATRNRFGETVRYDAEHVIVATGYFDHPNRLGIPGEELPKVSHIFQEAHPYTGLKVAIVGGNNSAVDAALELARVGADVTVVYRKPVISPKVKAWVRPVFESLISKERIRMLFQSRLTEIREREIVVETAGDGEAERTANTLPNDFVLVLTGFRPDRALLGSAGVELDPETGSPQHNPETMETNVPGLYIAGVIAAGSQASEIFIENGRFHGIQIAEHMLGKGK
ncbi:hypothetical protein J31TS4_26290 [Paenibacillus sp. J31TS4]|uniref:YpdA family putative bacillithiol disulfide reductase n=1 Tax=Paenibacillus sp. J31TS4 TaxID=2807195 RepID=UPI001AFE0F14|nr:YpdA family putative bacillithiol disulfide reductase [Paenibacillus sp. J31TS4]GIP39349.1 hypothetical protein J31TS4_26290 [Paenibacillus sp. J31TS4]